MIEIPTNDCLYQPISDFEVVHLHNKSKQYHLTKRLLFRSMELEGGLCFFSPYFYLHQPSFFHSFFGSFATLINKNAKEIDVYLNEDEDALNYIIEYIQNHQLDPKSIYTNSWETFNKTIILSRRMRLCHLTEALSSIKPREKEIEKRFNLWKNSIECLCYLADSSICRKFNIKLDHTRLNSNLEKFFQRYHDSFIDNFIKQTFHCENTKSHQIMELCYIYLSALLGNFFDKNNCQKGDQIEDTRKTSQVEN